MLFLFGTERAVPHAYSPSGDTPNVPLPPAVTYLALGDSYTIGQSVGKDDRFPMQTVSMMRSAGYNMADADIIATTGWTTGNLLQALKEKDISASYDFVSLLIGVNNQFRGLPVDRYRAEFTALLRKSIRLAGNRPDRVVVVSIPDYSVTPFAIGPIDRDKIAREINQFNRVNKQLAAAYRVHYLNVTEESRKAALYPALIASDGLHFSAKEYKIWAALLAAIMKQSMDGKGQNTPATGRTAAI
ncbi:MAG: SGNH/GDSL hydrolase family protein [Williamsia sp.]|nr:SGNH/GDSL hydrolase family protein [Williamsia sp.]